MSKPGCSIIFSHKLHEFSEFSHEFQTLSDIGEDELFYIESENKYLNKEIVESKARVFDNTNEVEIPLKEVFGENIIGVEDLAKFLNIPVEKTTKTILFETPSGRVIAAAVRGEYEVCENKLRKIIGEDFELASE